MRLGYYPGCSLQGSSREFGESVEALCAALEITLVELKDWNCCGASSAHVMDPDLALALPAKILAQAEAQGLEEVLAPCSACYARLMSAKQAMATDPVKAARIHGLLEQPYTGQVAILNVLELLDRVKDRIATKIQAPFTRRVASYYGCLLVRPPRPNSFDRPENPQSMDRLATLAGATPIDWAFKTECCGAAFSISRTDLVAKLSGRIVADAAKRGAELLLVACPMCHSNLDLRRDEINDHLGADHQLPVLYLTQMLGLAMGISPRELGLHRHMVPVAFQSAQA